MVLHEFVCDGCKIVETDTDTMSLHICPNCGEYMRWNTNIATHGNYEHPIHSDALAITPDQVEEHKREFPNVRLDGALRPVFDNYTNHEAYLKKTGFVKQTQKIRNKGKRIA